MNNITTRNLAKAALLIAMILLMAFTPLGYLRMPGLEITFIMIPVVIGAVILGPSCGALLGFMFGLTSLIQSFQSSFGAALLAASVPATVFTCFVPRILMGWLTGLIYKRISAKTENSLLTIAAANLVGPLLNTVLFMTSLMLFFGRTEFILSLRGGAKLFPFLVAFVGLNGLIEAVVSLAVGTAICKALLRRKPE